MNFENRINEIIALGNKAQSVSDWDDVIRQLEALTPEEAEKLIVNARRIGSIT